MNTDTKWQAISLIYGPPRDHWLTSHLGMTLIPDSFTQALLKVFGYDEIARVGAKRLAKDYAEWYYLNENHTGQSAGDDGLLPGAQADVRE